MYSCIELSEKYHYLMKYFAKIVTQLTVQFSIWPVENNNIL